ncbi:hypothetical protein KSP40_PGU012263 [Platanthera guangdongensis]|uniref:DUF7755 domain-containing protein n=1 Tax=Platanthera guangdongensis TaxID=2320717 RepID=A0ABR2LLM4_9ASPA
MDMETLSVGHLIPSVQATSLTRWRRPYSTSDDFPRVSLFPRKVEKRIDNSLIIFCSKRSVYQDFQDFAKPLHLLPATQITTYPTDYSEKTISSLELDHSTSLYMIELRTSRDFASWPSDLNSAIMICLIDENGRSILQRISAISQERRENL